MNSPFHPLSLPDMWGKVHSNTNRETSFLPDRQQIRDTFGTQPHDAGGRPLSDPILSNACRQPAK